jgi:hypothetical protein
LIGVNRRQKVKIAPVARENPKWRPAQAFIYHVEMKEYEAGMSPARLA